MGLLGTISSWSTSSFNIIFKKYSNKTWEIEWLNSRWTSRLSCDIGETKRKKELTFLQFRNETINDVLHRSVIGDIIQRVTLVNQRFALGTRISLFEVFHQTTFADCKTTNDSLLKSSKRSRSCCHEQVGFHHRLFGRSKCNWISWKCETNEIYDIK